MVFPYSNPQKDMMYSRNIADRMDGLPCPPRYPLPKSPSQLPPVQEESDADAEDDESDACRSVSPLEGEDSISWGSYDSDARPTKVKFKMSSYDSLDKLAMPTHSILKVKTTRPFADVANLDDITTNQHLRHDIDVLQHKMLRGHHHMDYMNQSPFTYVPDQVVVQLYMFDAEHHGGMWHEAGRYIKYEESVEGIDTMWSRPHVPFLPFLNVMILRKLLESDQSMCALDVDGTTFGEICHNMATELEQMGGLNHEDTNALVAFLNFRRDHAKNNQVRYNWIRKLTGSGRDGVALLFQRDPPSRCMSTSAIDPPKKQNSNSSLEMPRRAYESFSSHLHAEGEAPEAGLPDVNLPNKRTSVEILHSSPVKKVPEYQPLLTVPQESIDGASFHSLRSEHSHASSNWEADTSAPDGSECVHLLVGRTGFFENTKFIFIRLKHALCDPLLTKKRVPVRFFVLIVGPAQGNNEYLELGRVFATLCTNKEFVSSLYHLSTRQEILRSFDNVLQQMTMIPPSSIDSPDVFSVEEYEKVVRRSKLRQRKKSKKSHLPKIVEGKEFFDQLKPNNTDINSLKIKFEGKPKLFEGFINDFHNMRQRYISDFRDINSGKTMALITTISIYLSLLMPTIAFGKILQKITDQRMGVMECFYSTAISGLIWGLFSAQPMLIQSVTGPIVIFEGSFFMLCKHANLDYMEVRLYAGFTIALCSFLTITFNGSRLLKFITGFTEEIFCSLIALIYVMETGHYLYHEYVENPSKGFKFYKDYTNPCLTELIEQGKNITVHTAFECDLPRPNAGLMAILVVIICFGIAFVLYQLRFSELLGRCVRNYLSDFNILITLVITSILIYFMVSPGVLNTVEIPETLQWTNATLRGHGYLIIPNATDTQRFGAHILAGVAGGVMVFVLEFAETAMCEIMLEQKDRKFQKTGGITWDLFVMSICALISSIFGLPWMCAAGVQTLSHAQGLSYPKKTPPGAKPEVDYVVEQRVTTISLAVLFAGTTFMGKYLNDLAVPCLFGIFLYVGTTSMIESTLFKGLVNSMHFGKHFRHTHTDMDVPANRIRIYRFLQLVALITIYTVKQFAELAILFPVVFIMFIACRHFVLPLIYTEDELNALDPVEDHADSETSDDKPKTVIPIAV